MKNLITCIVIDPTLRPAVPSGPLRPSPTELERFSRWSNFCSSATPVWSVLFLA
jgi:hypothetical protein